jgi:hypothetical protein
MCPHDRNMLRPRHGTSAARSDNPETVELRSCYPHYGCGYYILPGVVVPVIVKVLGQSGSPAMDVSIKAETLGGGLERECARVCRANINGSGHIGGFGARYKRGTYELQACFRHRES